MRVEEYKTIPMRHQVHGVEHCQEVCPAGGALFDEQGTGKSKQAVDWACETALDQGTQTFVVVCPAGARGTWAGPEYGQVRLHCWLPWELGVYDGKALKKGIEFCQPQLADSQYSPTHLTSWIVVSYSFLRNDQARERLEEYLRDRRWAIVVDEAHFVKNRSAKQSKAVAKLRYSGASACLLLTGTPYANDVTDLWSILNIMDREVFPYNYYAFRSAFAKLQKVRYGVNEFEKVVGVKNKERLDKLVKPRALRRMQEDCVDLPEKVYSAIEVPMSSSAWEQYSSMRDDLVAWTGERSSTAANAGVKAVRLQQLTSGFLGGVRSSGCDRCGRPEWEHWDLDAACPEGFYSPLQPPIEVDASKLEAFMDWREGQAGPVLSWCRFRPEIARLELALRNRGSRVGLIWGGQSDRQRFGVIDALTAGQLDDVVAQPQAGGVSLNLQAAHVVAYLSNDFSLTNRLQSEARVHRKGQAHKVQIVDFVCTSPDGKKTIDHLVLQAIRQKRELADFTMEEWRTALVK